MVPDSALLYTALIGFVVVAILFALELSRWRRIGNLVGKRQRALRTVLIILFESFFLMIMVSPWVSARCGKVAQLGYWFGCMLIGLAVVVLAFVDLRAVIKGYGALTRRMLDELKGDDEKTND